jgi:anthranilate synthase/phosphoribosyltransferase
MVLLIDNYDSFTYNVYQYLLSLGQKVKVVRNDKITCSEIASLAPSHIIISPGPGRPENAGVVLETIKTFKGKIPILGICLGNQAIGLAFGAKVIRAHEMFHGKFSDIIHDGRTIFAGITNPFSAVRYHSLIVSRPSLPDELEISAWTEEGEVMGLRHRLYSIEGLQFHPESIGTVMGRQILENFLSQKPERSGIQGAISKVCARQDLTEEESEKVMEEITSGLATPAQVAGFLTAQTLKGFEVSEISGFARVMRKKATVIEKPMGHFVIDTCGTGGDHYGSFNISTVAAFIASAAGVVIAKHGNRSVTSRCGSADLLEALGVNIAADVTTINESLQKCGMGFLFAPKLHGSMKHAVSVRRDIGIRTIFNILGPLSNPAGADGQLIGVFNSDLIEKMAQALLKLGCKRAMVVHGSDGLDEITLTGPTEVAEVREGWLKKYEIHPKQLGFSLCKAEDLKGGDLHQNCAIALDILDGKEQGPKREVTIINAAAAIYLAGRAENLSEGVALAKKALDTGAAAKKLQELISITNK